MTEFVVLGNPESERVSGFQSALARQARPPASVVPWKHWLTGAERLDDHLLPGAILRIESPGEDATVERLLLARGANLPDERFQAPGLESEACLALPDDPGRILHPRQHFLGLRHALRKISEILSARSGVAVMNDPGDIVSRLDKPTTDELLRQSGVPRPTLLGFPRSFDELSDQMQRQGCSRVFVKLSNGSSASGVVAYQTHGRRQIAITSTEVVRERGQIRLYNSKHIRRYILHSEIRILFDALCREGVLVETWIPKASLNGGAFDLRVVVIGGRARHVVVRQSPTPLTNLHLGKSNSRGDPSVARSRMGEAAWDHALQTCEKAAAAFPGSLYSGVDLIVCSRTFRPFVAEVNAFGDLLRRTIHNGQDPYEAEIAQALEVVA